MLRLCTPRSCKAPLIIFSAILSQCLTACVAVQIQAPKTTRFTEASYSPPATPFEKVESEKVDTAWRSTDTGNTIAYLSECANSSSGLQQLQSEVVAALENAKLQSSTSTSFNDRDALRSTWSGSVEGQQVKLTSLVFRKNGCSHTLMYAGPEGKFSNELTIFEQFTERFRIP